MIVNFFKAGRVRYFHLAMENYPAFLFFKPLLISLFILYFPIRFILYTNDDATT